jgi:hypothetical protein
MELPSSKSSNGAAIPFYMKRYMIRLGGFMAAYAAILVCGLTLARTGVPQWLAICLAVLTAAPICGVFWAIFRLLAECDDEYQRLLFVKQTLLATAFTLAITTVWQFLAVYDVLAQGPQWIGAIWFAMIGIAAPIARWRA